MAIDMRPMAVTFAPTSNAERQRMWRENHPDRVAAYNARRRVANAPAHWARIMAQAKPAPEKLALPAPAPLALPAPPVRLALPAPSELPAIILPIQRERIRVTQPAPDREAELRRAA
jgi:hypothetical protein